MSMFKNLMRNDLDFPAFHREVNNVAACIRAGTACACCDAGSCVIPLRHLQLVVIKWTHLLVFQDDGVSERLCGGWSKDTILVLDISSETYKGTFSFFVTSSIQMTDFYNFIIYCFLKQYIIHLKYWRSRSTKTETCVICTTRWHLNWKQKNWKSPPDDIIWSFSAKSRDIWIDGRQREV